VGGVVTAVRCAGERAVGGGRDGTNRRNPGPGRAGDAGRPACRCPPLHARAGEDDRVAAFPQPGGQNPPRAEICRLAGTCAACPRRQGSNRADPGCPAGYDSRLRLDSASLRRSRHDSPGGDRNPRPPDGREARAHAGNLPAAWSDPRGRGAGSRPRGRRRASAHDHPREGSGPA
jgi:hypothetical protein